MRKVNLDMKASTLGMIVASAMATSLVTGVATGAILATKGLKLLHLKKDEEAVSDEEFEEDDDDFEFLDDEKEEEPAPQPQQSAKAAEETKAEQVIKACEEIQNATNEVVNTISKQA